MSHHPRFDLDRWIREFPLARVRQEAHATGIAPSGEILCGPRDLAVVEQIRREILAAEPALDGVPTDVFVWGRGEPAAPYLTKIGGLPFRSRNLPWPHTAAGARTLFLAQLSFVDSRDLVPPDLEGDLLLVFADPYDLLDESSYVLEWARADEPSPVRDGDVPSEWLRPAPLPPEAIPPFFHDKPLPPSMTAPLEVMHGVIHRTRDYPGADDRFRMYGAPWLLSVTEGTKIAGVPRFIQDADQDVPGFLGALGSLGEAPERKYPWVDVEVPVPSFEAAYSMHHLMFGDMGSLYLFRPTAGEVVARTQFY